MDTSQQTKLCDSLNGIIGAVSDKKVTVDSANAYESNGINGIRFIAKIKERQFVHKEAARGNGYGACGGNENRAESARRFPA